MARVRDYKIGLRLKDDVHLDMLLFSSTEHRWIFNHGLRLPEQRRRGEKPTLVSNVRLVVEYDRGVSQDCSLLWHFIRPDRRGKTFLFGIDISEGSLVDMEFLYEKCGHVYQMKTVLIGAQKRIDLNSLDDGLVPSADLPFPLQDPIANENGVYKFPFLKKDGAITFFEFPEDYRNR